MALLPWTSSGIALQRSGRPQVQALWSTVPMDACHLLPLSNSNSACSRVSLRSIPWNWYASGHLPRHHRRALRSFRMRATLSDLGTDSFRLPRDRAAQGIIGCLPAPTRARRPPAVRSAHARPPAKVPGPAHCRHIGGRGPHRRSDAIVRSPRPEVALGPDRADPVPGAHQAILHQIIRIARVAQRRPTHNGAAMGYLLPVAMLLSSCPSGFIHRRHHAPRTGDPRRPDLFTQLFVEREMRIA
jgi:hypothetical protein